MLKLSCFSFFFNNCFFTPWFSIFQPSKPFLSIIMLLNTLLQVLIIFHSRQTFRAWCKDNFFLSEPSILNISLSLKAKLSFMPLPLSASNNSWFRPQEIRAGIKRQHCLQINNVFFQLSSIKYVPGQVKYKSFIHDVALWPSEAILDWSSSQFTSA